MKGKNKSQSVTGRNAPENNVAASAVKFSTVELAVTLAVGIAALGLAATQLFGGTRPGHEMKLAALNERADALQKITDPIQRDSYCIPLSAYGRSLDKALDKNARVFFSGLIGKTNAGGLGYYYFIQNHLFPREVEFSLDNHAVYTGAYFNGVPCDSPAELQAKGFDLMIRLGPNGIQLLPLTAKGTPHE